MKVQWQVTINGESFRTYVEKVLVPTLQPGEIVFMDKLACHKAEAVRLAIRLAGARLFFLPKYSPDLNPIEQVFAKLKHLLRKAQARSVDVVSTCIGKLLEAFSHQERTSLCELFPFKNWTARDTDSWGGIEISMCT